MLKKLLTLSLVLIGAFTLAACAPEEDTTETPVLNCEETPEDPACEDVMTNLEKLSEALGGLTLPTETSADLTLPDTGLHGVTIAWSSDNEAVISNEGVVTIPAFSDGDATVKLTATLTLGEDSFTKDYTVVVAAAAETDLDKATTAIKSLLIVETIIVGDMSLIDTHQGYPVTWASDNEMYLTGAGVVTRPDADTGNVVVTLTATLTVNEAVVTKEFSITVQAEEPAMTFASIADMYQNAILDDYIEFTGIVTGTFDGGYFLSDGTHALGIYSPGSELTVAIGDEIKVRGFYAVYNTLYQLGNIVSEEVLTTGNVNPLEGTAVVKTVAEMLALDASVSTIHGMYYTITGTVELRGDYNNVYLVEGDDAVLIYYYSNEASLAALEAQAGKEVTITVFYYTNHGTNGPMLAFDGLEADITVNELSDAEALEADIAAIEVPEITLESFMLPAVGPNGTMFSGWTSDNDAVIGNDGTFVALGAETTVVTFTATATKGSLTETVTVEVVVPVLSTVQEVLDMNNGDLFQVSGVVFDISYYGLFIENNGSYIFIYSKQYDGPVVVGDEVKLLGSRGEYNGLKQINLKSDMEVLTSGNALPMAVDTTVAAVQYDVVPRGTMATITGTVSIEGSYSNVYLTDSAGGKVQVYYRSNASELEGFVGQIITVTVVTYHDELVLFQGVAADATVETDFTEAYTAQAAADAIDLGMLMEVNVDFVLPTENTTAVATITWATSDAAVVTDAGVITMVSGSNATATLTASVTVGATTVTRDFVVELMDLNDNVPLTVTEALLEADDTLVLVKGIIVGKYYDEVIIQDETGAALYVDSSVGGDLGDEIVVAGTLGLNESYGDNQRELNGATKIETLSTGNALVVSAVTDPAVIVTEVPNMHRYTATLEISSMDDGFGYAHFVGDGTTFLKLKLSTEAPAYFADMYTVGQTVELTFTVSDIDYDNARIVSVEWPMLTDAQALTLAQDGLSVPANATADVTLPTEMYGVAIAWASDNAAITDAGVVTRPAEGQADATVTLTATLTIGSETPVDVTFTVTVPAEAPPVPELFISEYAEADGGSCKYIEIYNPTGADVDLTPYSVVKGGNGTAYADSSDVYDLTGTLAAGAVIVLGNSACTDPGDAAQGAGLANPFPTTGINFVVTTVVGYVNGDDALGLFKDGVLIDTLGLNGIDPGSNWPVGNGNTTDGTTANVILIRVPTVTFGSDDWAVVAEQWIVATDNRDYSTVGNHTTS